MIHPLLDTTAGAEARPIHVAAPETWPQVASALSPTARAFAEAQGFAPKPGAVLVAPNAEGAIEAVVLGQDPGDHFLAGKLPGVLPDGLYAFARAPADPALATLAWLMGSYAFTRYRARPTKAVRLVVPDGVDAEEVTRIAEAVAMGRDLINTPANDLGPEEIEAAARRVAERHGAELDAIVGDALLERNFPMIHAVGRASPRLPRLVDMRWGAPGAPKVTIIGKGVAFDTGGLDIKPSASMLLMKKDMGGAAAALALADMIMGAGLPVRLRVLIAAVENAISGSAFRPGDVLPSRKGLTVEIGNTDAEGRLILGDALAKAAEANPELILDFATLTGAARVALGPDLPAMFANDDALANDLMAAGEAAFDPIWRMPLWKHYNEMLASDVADLGNATDAPMAGAVTAALFLQRFVPEDTAWAHFDTFAWRPIGKPGRPKGGDALGMRAAWHMLKGRYAA
jgi:leucyl aminopeptidase